jgi:Lar family restriction alleviation protein
MGGSVSMIDGHIDEVLKPCPFCGGKATARKFENGWYGVVCDDCPCDFGRYWLYTREEAIEAWNRRADA